MNISDTELVFKKDRKITTGWICQQLNEELTPPSEVLRVEQHEMEPLRTEEITVGPITRGEHKDLIILLNKYSRCFAMKTNELGTAKSSELKITLSDQTPVCYRPYRMSATEREKVRSITQELMEANVIRESDSPYTSPILLVKKKDGEDRMCVDYRKLNSRTIKDHYPLPRIDDQIDRLYNCKYFTCLDLRSGYHQIPIAEESRHLTSFITPDGQYEYNRMPFGLANAPSVFQRLMNKVLGSLRYDSVTVYLDDILIPSSTVADGLKRLEEVLLVLQDEGLTLKLEKCAFLTTSVNYLGFEIDRNGIKPGLQKTKAISEFPTPTNVHNVRQFLGLTTYFRQFVSGFSRIARPLNLLTRKTQEWKWNEEQATAFQQLKKILTSRPVLAIFNPEAVTEVHTDASKYGVAGILLQKNSSEKLHPIGYYSRQTSCAEQKYHSYELEVLAVVESLRKFTVYLHGRKFTLVTDCNAIKTAHTKRDLNSRIARWWLQLAEFDFDIQYRPGKRMAHVDALSRNPSTTETAPPEVTILQIENLDWFLAGQLADTDLRNIHEVLSRYPELDEERKIHEEYELKDNKIFRKTTQGTRLVVPHGMRREIVRTAHDELGHFATDKTVHKLNEHYWFAGMKSYVNRYISCCIQCLYNKKPSGSKQGFLHPIQKIGTPFHTIHIDHLGLFIRSSHRNAYLIVAIDAFTKFLLMKAVKTTDAKDVIRYLNEIINIYGTPNRIISDRGTAFTARKFKEFCSSMGITHILNAVATPRANGQCERYHRTIISGLKTSSDEDDKWDEIIPKIQFAVNNTINKTTGKTASQLLYGYKPRAPADAKITAELEYETQDDIMLLREEALERIIAAQKTQKELFDRKRVEAKVYKIGDLVLIEKANIATGSSQKLLPPFAGPFIVSAVLPNDRYEVTDMPGSERSQRAKYKNVVAVDRMRPWLCENGLSDNETSDETD